MFKFCGLTIRSLQNTLGLNSQRGELRVTLVQDIGDSPVFPPENSPVYFVFGGMNFTGLFKRYSKSIRTTGIFYDVYCSDISEVLDAVVVITENISSPPLNNNIMNIYGWYENTLGFGSSNINSSGMEFLKIKAGIGFFANSPFTSAYGGRIIYNGFRYKLDLSDLVLPIDFRMNVSGSSILQIIDEAASAMSVDYFFILIGNIIKVKTINRTSQNNIGATQILVESAAYSGLVVDSSIGIEGKEYISDSMLAGGLKEEPFISATIHSYWGDTIGGAPIIGVPGPHPDFPNEPCEFFTIPTPEIADVLGSLTYATNTIEMRCALNSEDLWSNYCTKYKPAIAALINPIFNLPINAIAKIDLMNDDVDAVARAVNDNNSLATSVIYNHIRKYAEEFFGKRFLVRVPNVLIKPAFNGIGAEYSHEPTSSGWIDGGAISMGIPITDAIKFEDQSGKVIPFAVFTNVDKIELSDVDAISSSISNNNLVMPVSINEKMVVIGNKAYVKVDLNGIIHERQIKDGDGLTLSINNINPNAFKNQAAGTLSEFIVYPNAIYPATVMVPLRSNKETYGPWSVRTGGSGRTEYFEDSSLVPWQYGGTEGMNAAGLARVSTNLSLQTRSEYAEFTIAGIPNNSAGDVLIASGPAATSIDVRYDTGGFLTTFRFNSFTPINRAAFTRQYLEKIKRLNSIALDSRRKVLRNATNRAAIRQALKDAKRERGFRKKLPKWKKQETPYSAIISRAVRVGAEDVRILTGLTTQEEAIVLSNPTSELDYQDTATISLSSIFRPFASAVSTNLAYNDLPTTFPGNSPDLTADNLHPYKAGHDIEMMTWGDTFAGFKGRERGPDYKAVRGIAIKGPLWLEGFGFDLNGVAVGGSNNKQSNLDKVGPVDFLWDGRRKVWTSHDIYRVDTDGITAGETATCYAGGDEEWPIDVYNHGPDDIPSGSILAGYVVNKGRWEALPSGCSKNKVVKNVCINTDSYGAITGIVVEYIDENGNVTCVTNPTNCCNEATYWCTPESGCIEVAHGEDAPAGSTGPYDSLSSCTGSCEEQTTWYLDISSGTCIEVPPGGTPPTGAVGPYNSLAGCEADIGGMVTTCCPETTIPTGLTMTMAGIGSYPSSPGAPKGWRFSGFPQEVICDSGSVFLDSIIDIHCSGNTFLVDASLTTTTEDCILNSNGVTINDMTFNCEPFLLSFTMNFPGLGCTCDPILVTVTE